MNFCSILDSLALPTLPSLTLPQSPAPTTSPTLTPSQSPKPVRPRSYLRLSAPTNKAPPPKRDSKTPATFDSSNRIRDGIDQAKTQYKKRKLQKAPSKFPYPSNSTKSKGSPERRAVPKSKSKSKKCDNSFDLSRMGKGGACTNVYITRFLV